MTIHTGYFAQLKKYKDAGLTPISIARYKPKWYMGAEYKSLAPDAFLVKKHKNHLISREAYKFFYFMQLDNLTAQKVLDDLQAISEGKDVILLCYESPYSNFCHRHLIRQYVKEHWPELGDIQEFLIPKPKLK